MSKALGALLAYAWTALPHLMRIEALVYAYNHPSIAVLRKHGFVHEGVLRKAAYKGGKFVDSWVFGLTRDMVPGVPEWAGDVAAAGATRAAAVADTQEPQEH
jgi:ribosomal-protein-alanine N-acetyltransferase